MDERERVLRILQTLNLPVGQYVIDGSGSMILHGITKEQRQKTMGDLDIFCSTRLWFELMPEVYPSGNPKYKVWTSDPLDPARRCDPPYLVRDMLGLEVNIFFSWRIRHVGDKDVNFLIANPYFIGGSIPCVPLQFILDWKRAVGRSKDVRDICVLERFLGPEAL